MTTTVDPDDDTHDEPRWKLASGAQRLENRVAHVLGRALAWHGTGGLLPDEWDAVQRLAAVGKELQAIHDMLDPENECRACDEPVGQAESENNRPEPETPPT